MEDRPSMSKRFDEGPGKGPVGDSKRFDDLA
jgi:hypothetical protein